MLRREGALAGLPGGILLVSHAVVSFGIVPVSRGRIDLTGAVYQEVAPSTPLSHGSIAVHHLRPTDLAEAPPLTEVAERLRAGMEGRYLLTWSAEIEATFLSRTFGGSVRRWLSRTVDVLRLAILADRIEGKSVPEDSYSLAQTVARAGLPVEEAHDALNDALMTAEMFLVLTAQLAPYGFKDVRSLIKPTRANPERLLRTVSRYDKR